MYRVAQKRNINKSYCRGVRKYVVAAAVLMSSSSWGGVFPGCCITTLMLNIIAVCGELSRLVVDAVVVVSDVDKTVQVWNY